MEEIRVVNVRKVKKTKKDKLIYKELELPNNALFIGYSMKRQVTGSGSIKYVD